MKEISGKPEQIQNISPGNPSPHKGKTLIDQEGGSFGKVLSEQIDEANETNKGNQIKVKSNPLAISQGLPELESSFQAEFINTADKGTTITEKISSSIDLLEKYASWLLDPEKTLKQAHGLLENLDGQTSELNKDLKLSSNTDEELKQIITQLTTIIQVEQIKINRGDYLDIT